MWVVLILRPGFGSIALNVLQRATLQRHREERLPELRRRHDPDLPLLANERRGDEKVLDRKVEQGVLENLLRLQHALQLGLLCLVSCCNFLVCHRGLLTVSVPSSATDT